MPEKKQWRMVLFAARKIFQVGRPAEDAELQPWLDENPGASKVLEEYSDPEALIGDAIRCNHTDVAAAWDRFVEINPSMAAVPKADLFPKPPLVVRILKSRRYRPWLIVASLLLLLTIGGLCFPSWYKAIFKPDARTTIVSLPVISDGYDALARIQPGSYKLLIILPDQDTLKASALPKKDTLIYKNVVVRRVGEGTIVFSPFSNPGGRTTTILLSAPRGGWYNVVLPDQTKVCLNAASSIRFSTAFARDQRTFTLVGEAYIQTAVQRSDTARPPLRILFDGRSDLTQLIAPGSACNISAYPDDPGPFIRTTVVKGSVRVRDSTASVELHSGSQYTLYPGRQDSLEVHADTVESVGWKNGRFLFNGLPVPVIMRNLGRWYSARIDCHDPPDGIFTLKALRSQPIRDILGMLDSSGHINCTVVPDSIPVTHKKPI